MTNKLPTIATDINHVLEKLRNAIFVAMVNENERVHTQPLDLCEKTYPSAIGVSVLALDDEMRATDTRADLRISAFMQGDQVVIGVASITGYCLYGGVSGNMQRAYAECESIALDVAERFDWGKVSEIFGGGKEPHTLTHEALERIGIGSVANTIALAIHNDWQNDGATGEYFKEPKEVHGDPRADKGACYTAYPMRVIVGKVDSGRVFALLERADTNVYLMEYAFDNLKCLEKDINRICKNFCDISRGRDAE